MISDGSCDTEDWVMMLKIQLWIMGINYILKYSKIEKKKNIILNWIIFHNITVFLCIVDQINPDLMSIRDFFQKH